MKEGKEMFGQRSRIRRAMRNTVLWTGLLLMIASFAWMQWISKPEPGTSTQEHARERSHARRGAAGRSIVAVGRSRHRDDAGWRWLCLVGRARGAYQSRAGVRSCQHPFQRRQQTRLKRDRDLLCRTSNPARNADHLVASVFAADHGARAGP